jgi:alpha-acetolactate decarboxylase
MKSTIHEYKKNNKTSMSKNFILTLVFAFVSTAFYAQGAFDKFDGQDDVTSVIVNKKMFDIMSKVKVDASDKETQQYMALIKKLDNLKVFTTKNAKIESDMKITADKYIKSANLEELMRINDSGKNVKIYVKSGANDTTIKELFMFIDGSKNEDTVLLSLIGNFDLNEISVLTDKMKLPGGTDLKKASKSKK